MWVMNARAPAGSRAAAAQGSAANAAIMPPATKIRRILPPSAAPARPGSAAIRPVSAQTERLLKRVEDGKLAGQDPGARFVDRQPGGTVHLGEGSERAAPRREFHLEVIADDHIGVEIAFDREGFDPFPAPLADPAKMPRLTLRPGPQLLLELAQRGGLGLLAGFDCPLGDHPGAFVPVAPEGTAGMGEKHLERATASPVENDTGTRQRHFRASGTNALLPESAGGNPHAGPTASAACAFQPVRRTAEPLSAMLPLTPGWFSVESCGP